jgi:hypothetical protein
MALFVISSGLYSLKARSKRGYDDPQARKIFRDLIVMPADVAVTDGEIKARFHRRTHLPSMSIRLAYRVMIAFAMDSVTLASTIVGSSWPRSVIRYRANPSPPNCKNKSTATP